MHLVSCAGGDDGGLTYAFRCHTLGFGLRPLAKIPPGPNNVSSMEERVDAGEANPGRVGASMEHRLVFDLSRIKWQRM